MHFLCVCGGVGIDIHSVQFTSSFFQLCSEAVLTCSPVMLNLASDQESVNIFDHDFTFVPLQSQFTRTSYRNTAVGFGDYPLIVSTSGCL